MGGSEAGGGTPLPHWFWNGLLADEVQQVGGVVGDVPGAGGEELGGSAEAPGGADGGHAGVVGGLHVHGHVAEVDELLWGEGKALGDFEGGGRVGLVGELRAGR